MGVLNWRSESRNPWTFGALGGGGETLELGQCLVNDGLTRPETGYIYWSGWSMTKGCRVTYKRRRHTKDRGRDWCGRHSRPPANPLRNSLRSSSSSQSPYITKMAAPTVSNELPQEVTTCLRNARYVPRPSTPLPTSSLPANPHSSTSPPPMGSGRTSRS